MFVEGKVVELLGDQICVTTNSVNVEKFGQAPPPPS
jgi:hypothetical protein